MTDVGVAVFSLTRKRSVRTLKLQTSTPLPAIAEKPPPMNPVNRSTMSFHNLNSGIVLYVFRLWKRFNRNRAKANANHTHTNPIFFWGGVRLGSMNSKPIIMPKIPPREQSVKECHSSCTRIQKMVKAAAIIPQDWIISEKSRATAGAIPKARVITGKATEPPPSLVIPVNGEKELFYGFFFFCIKKNLCLTDCDSMRYL